MLPDETTEPPEPTLLLKLWQELDEDRRRELLRVAWWQRNSNGIIVRFASFTLDAEWTVVWNRGWHHEGTGARVGWVIADVMTATVEADPHEGLLHLLSLRPDWPTS